MRRLLLGLLLVASTTGAQTTVTVTGDGAATVVTAGITVATGPTGAIGPGSTFVVAAVDSTDSTGADYTCDGTADEVQINAAIQALPTVGGRVMLLDGTYTINAAIVMKNGTWLQGQGPGTVVQIVAGHAGSIDMIAARANGANSNLVISDLTLDGNDITTIQGIYLTQSPDATLADNVRIERCTIKNGSGSSYGVMVYGATNLLIQDSYLYNWDDSAMELKASNRLRVARNTIIDGSLQLYAQSATGLSFIGNYVISQNTFKDATIVFTDAAAILQNVVLADNVWYETDDVASNRSVVLRAANNISITGNTFDCTEDTAYGAAPIVAYSTVTNLVFVNNTIKVSATADSNTGGIDTDAIGAIFEGNTITVSANHNYGIRADSASAGLVIRGNRLIGNAGANTNCLLLSSTTNATVQDNVCDTWGGTGINVAVTSTGTRVFDNRMLGTVTTSYSILDTTALFRDQAGLTFASLPADVADGSQVYCSDCTVASPCADTGTGALAKRLNNTWVCN